MQYSENHTK